MGTSIKTTKSLILLFCFLIATMVAVADSRIEHDTGDETVYDTTANTFFWKIGDVSKLNLTSTNLTVYADLVVDSAFDITGNGSGLSSIPSAGVIYDGSELVEEILDDIINPGILDAITVHDIGGCAVNWSTGEVFNQTHGKVVDTVPGSGSGTSDSINYLKWVSGDNLTISTTEASGVEVAVASFDCQSGDIWGEVHMTSIASRRESNLIQGIAETFAVMVSDGLVVSEDDDATNVWDLERTAGEFHFDGHDHIVLVANLSRTYNLTQWFHNNTGGWEFKSDAEINTTHYDNGTHLIANTANKYYKSSTFTIDDGAIHWVYPTAEYTTVGQAIAAASPALPPGLEGSPRSTDVILRGNAASFPTAGGDQWIDRRPIIGADITGIVTDHGNMAGLLDDDHPQYPLESETNSWYLNITNAQAEFFNRSTANSLFLNISNAHTEFFNISNGHTTFFNRSTANTLFLNITDAHTEFLNNSNAHTTFFNDSNAHTTFFNISNGHTTFFNRSTANELFINISQGIWNRSGTSLSPYSGADNELDFSASNNFTLEATPNNNRIEWTSQPSALLKFIVDNNQVLTLTNTGGIRTISGTAINEFSTDGTLGGNSNASVPTEQAVKTYVDSGFTGVGAYQLNNLTFPSDTHNGAILNTTGGYNLTVTSAGGSVIIQLGG